MHHYLQIGEFDGMQEHFYFNKCPCNEVKAITMRHCLEPKPGLNYTDFARELEYIECFCKRWINDTQKYNYASVMENTRNSIKKRYKRAYYDLKYNRVVLGEEQHRAKSFIKYEKMKINKLDAPPRLIQYRDFKYLYLLKSVLLPYAKFVKTCDEFLYDQKFSTHFTKTMNNTEAAQCLYDAWSEFESPVAICLDHSMFDGSITEELKRYERKFFANVLQSNLVNKLLKVQEKNTVLSQCKIKYKVKGSRLSGEYNTSDGNSIINLTALLSWIHHYGIFRHRVFVNGDDSIVMIESSDLYKLDLQGETVEYFKRYNFTTKKDRIVRDFRQISYCQASPIRVEGRWILCKDPIRTMSRMLYTDAKFKPIINRYMSGSLLCELAISSRIPVVGQFCIFLLSHFMDKPLGSVDKVPAKASGFDEISFDRISDETRADFEIAFDMSKSDQLSIEKELAGQLINAPNVYNYLYKYKTFFKQ